MKVLFGAGVLAAGLALCPASGHAQQHAPALFADNATLVTPVGTPVVLRHGAVQEPPSDKPEDQMSTSGFFLGMVGMLAGAAIGSQIGQADCPTREVDKDCMGRHAYTGALVAGTIFVPVGVHLASKSHGNLWLSLGVSAATGTLFYYAFKAVPGSPIAMAPFLATPVQVVTSVKIERRK